MAAGDQPDDDRTEAATQRHLDLARDEGQVPVSREVATFVGLAAVALMLIYQSEASIQRLLPRLIRLLADAGRATVPGAGPVLLSSSAALDAIVPILGAAAFAGAAAVLLQTNFLLTLTALQPKLSRVNPVAGAKRLFGFNGLVEIVKSLAKLGFLAVAMWIAIRGDWPRLVRLPWQAPRSLLLEVARPMVHLFVACLITQGVIAAADLGAAG